MNIYKFVIVSGRSSHSITAKSKSDAIKKFNQKFPYAKVKFITKVKIGNKSFKV